MGRRVPGRRSAVALVVAFSVALAAQTAVPSHRVIEMAGGRSGDVTLLAADLVSADVVFVGEEHNDVNTHLLERALLEAIAARRSNVVLALEMFERDGQESLERFRLGRLTEAEFLAGARPWPQYVRDYKPLVDFAIAQGWNVVAANVPRQIASAVAEQGLDALASRPAGERAFFASPVPCPRGDDYHRRFVTAMGGHGADGTPLAAQSLDRYYESQCLKDETMAESIAGAQTTGAAGGVGPLVVVINGAFHSDYGQGTVARVRSRLPERRVVVTTIVPVTSLDRTLPLSDARPRADYLIYSVRAEG